MNVVSEWRSLTELPAVLAVWAVKRDVATPEVTADFWHLAILACRASRKSATTPSIDLELPAPAIETYLRRNIDFSLDSENRRGLDLYYQHAARLGLIPIAKRSNGSK